VRLKQQGIAIATALGIGLAALLVQPAQATGDSDFVDLQIKGIGNGVMSALIQDGFTTVLEWDADVDTSSFDKLTWRILSAVDQDGDDVSFDIGASYAYYEDADDDVEYTVLGGEDFFGGDQNWVTPWALQGTDSQSAGNGFVGPYAWDATSAGLIANNTTVYLDYLDAWIQNPLFRVGTDEWWSVNDVKWTFRIQAFVDQNSNGEADTNETRSAVTSINLYNIYRLTGNVAQGSVPGWFSPELSPTIELDQKLANVSFDDDWSTEYNLAAMGPVYSLTLQQLESDGNDSDNYDFFDLSCYNTFDDADVDEDISGCGYGWTIAEDGTASYRDDFSYDNEGSKVNQVWLSRPAGCFRIAGEPEAGPSKCALDYTRVSNLATFGYVADSKIVKRSNTTAKMYAFDILNAGKVEFRHNGRVIARIDQVDEADPRALADGNRPYFVRTVNFVRGKNTLEVVVNGKVLKKHTYTLRSGMA
jgi:hypothetical protein